MTYLRRGPIAAKTPKMHWLELSTDQTYSAAGVVALDTLTSSASGGVSLSSNQITLTAGEWIINGCVALDRTDTLTSYQVNFRDGSQTVLTEADGWMDSVSIAADTASSLVLQARLILTSSTTFELYATGSAGSIKADGTHLWILEL